MNFFKRSRECSQRSLHVSKPSLDCRSLTILRDNFTHFHFFALFTPKSLFHSKITFLLQNHFFRSKITFLHSSSLFHPKSTFCSFGAPCLRCVCRQWFLNHFGRHFRPGGDFYEILIKIGDFSEKVTF